MRHGVSTEKARLAGLLHDVARLCSPQQLIDECSQRGMSIDALERSNPVLLHARLGAELARERFGVVDPDVLSAIAKHTHGDATMTPLDCVVYLADSLEPGRNFPERAALWELAQHDLAAAMHATLASMIRYLEQRGLAPAPQAAAAMSAFTPGKEPEKLPELIDIVREAALDKKGEDFAAIDVRDRTIIADVFAIVTGRSRIHVRSIAEAVAEAAERAGVHPRVEGLAEGGWVLLDLGGVVVHVFTPEQRSFYNIERLWSAVADRRARSS